MCVYFLRILIHSREFFTLYYSFKEKISRVLFFVKEKFYYESGILKCKIVRKVVESKNRMILF